MNSVTFMDKRKSGMTGLLNMPRCKEQGQQIGRIVVIVFSKGLKDE
jgi:hypothetical protein